MNKNIPVIIGLLVFAGVISWSSFFRQYSQSDTVNIHVFPRVIGGWTSREIPISEGDQEILETKNAFSRIYRSGNDAQVMLFIVYSQNNRKVSHPPEVCYTGSGATILTENRINIDLGQPQGYLGVNRFVSELQGRKLITYYWFKVGDTFTPDYWKQQLLIALKTLSGQPASSAMIRLSAASDESENSKADQSIQNFTRLILSAVKQYLP